MSQSDDDLDRRVRRLVYDVTLRRGVPPTVAATADGLSVSLQQIAASFQRLAAGRVLVLAPDSGEILMANPFSAAPTSFLVEFDDYACYGNCIWDAMGVVAMRSRDARIKASCGDCGAPMEAQIVSQALHFPHGVPTTHSPPGAGGTTSSSTERRCCSSGRKSMSIAGARSGRWNGGPF